jgi:hypothetical protein
LVEATDELARGERGELDPDLLSDFAISRAELVAYLPPLIDQPDRERGPEFVERDPVTGEPLPVTPPSELGRVVETYDGSDAE